jgi:hypothetical protein
MKVRFSTLWIFAVLNYVYCDDVTLENPAYMKGLVGKYGRHSSNPAFLWAAGVLVEVPIAMVLLSRILKYRGNRWANIIAGGLMAVVRAVSLFFSTPGLYYAFFSITGITAAVLIVWYACVEVARRFGREHA